MTTIAYRDGVLAADRRAYSGGKSPIGLKTKVERLKDGSLLGVSSTVVGASTQIRDWVERGCPLPAPDDLQPESFELLLIRPSGEVFYACNAPTLTGPLEAAFLAVGSGSDYALGAMSMGASAVEAVEVAASHDPWTGGGVNSLLLHP